MFKNWMVSLVQLLPLSHTTWLQTQFSALKPQAHIILKSIYYWMMTVWQWLSIYYWSYLLPQADEFSVDCIYNILKKFLFIRLFFFPNFLSSWLSIFRLLKIFPFVKWMNEWINSWLKILPPRKNVYTRIWSTTYFNNYLLSNYFAPETLRVRISKKSKVTGPAIREIHCLGKKSDLQTDTLILLRLGQR